MSHMAAQVHMQHTTSFNMMMHIAATHAGVTCGMQWHVTCHMAYQAALTCYGSTQPKQTHTKHTHMSIQLRQPACKHTCVCPHIQHQATMCMCHLTYGSRSAHATHNHLRHDGAHSNNTCMRHMCDAAACDMLVCMAQQPCAMSKLCAT